MKNEEYKKCQLKNLQKQQEDMKVAMLVFTKCARKIIRIHRHFFDSVKRCLRPNGRLVLRDVTSDNKVLVWLMNTLEMPLANICGHGDVQVPTRDVVIKCCKKQD